MRRGDRLVFDEFVVYTGTPVYTSAEHNTLLGTGDNLAIFAVVDQASVGGSLIVVLEHSADGRSWIAKNAPTAAEINSNNTFLATAQKAMWGYVKGVSPTLGEGRLKITFGAALNAHLRIHVTTRDPR